MEKPLVGSSAVGRMSEPKPDQGLLLPRNETVAFPHCNRGGTTQSRRRRFGPIDARTAGHGRFATMGEESDRFRGRAKQCRDLAKDAGDNDSRQTLNDIAGDLEAEAVEIDKG